MNPLSNLRREVDSSQIKPLDENRALASTLTTALQSTHQAAPRLLTHRHRDIIHMCWLSYKVCGVSHKEIENKYRIVFVC